MSWTDERVETAKKLWKDGLSASQIAGELGGITRSGVIGKLYRLGVLGNPEHQRKERDRPPRKPRTRSGYMTFRSRHAAVTAIETPAPVADVDIPVGQRKTLTELNARTCRWPVGDPQEPDFFFCGAEPAPGEPYCVSHCCAAWTSAPATSKGVSMRTGTAGRWI